MKGSDVLNNKLGLDSTDELERAEARIVGVNALQAFPNGRAKREPSVFQKARIALKHQSASSQS